MVHPRRKISGPANALQRAGDRILAARWMGGDLTLVRVVQGEDERLRRRGTALCHPERAQRVPLSSRASGASAPVIPSERSECPCHPERAKRVEGSAPPR